MARSRTWKTVDELPEIDWEGGALAALKGNGWTIVRRCTSGPGGFAVLALDGRFCRIVKVLPTLEAARAYQAAMHR